MVRLKNLAAPQDSASCRNMELWVWKENFHSFGDTVARPSSSGGGKVVGGALIFWHAPACCLLPTVRSVRSLGNQLPLQPGKGFSNEKSPPPPYKTRVATARSHFRCSSDLAVEQSSSAAQVTQLRKNRRVGGAEADRIGGRPEEQRRVLTVSLRPRLLNHPHPPLHPQAPFFPGPLPFFLDSWKEELCRLICQELTFWKFALPGI
ncbi:LOW QUALITY PROTEIN: hypothetical protein U9M48_044335 [Paspalum notatum var. saurae]|uniref:Uncharacterized protein n=1 Tax=Paspalum notatum var. saurae TaxID=547442 RepID=A0AAQ3XIA7_PASNO